MLLHGESNRESGLHCFLRLERALCRRSGRCLAGVAFSVLHVTTSLSTGGGPVSCVQLSEGGFQVVYPLGLWSRSSGVVKVLHGHG